MNEATVAGGIGWRDVAWLAPMWLVVLLQPVGRAAELGCLLAIVAVVVLALRDRRRLADAAGMRLVLLLFAAYVAAAAVSLPDAIRPERSWSTSVGLLRFFALGAFAVVAIDSRSRWRATCDVVALVTALWTLDAWLQLLTGFSLGGAAEAHRITGIFGADNVKLGIMLAAFAPFVLGAARDRFGRRGLILAFVFLLVPILVAGERQAWPCYALVAAAFAWRESRSWRRFALWMLAAGLVAVVAVAAAWSASPRFGARMQRSLALFDGSAAAVNTALSGRPDIWSVALKMIAAHPVNGVGVRDFRYAYPDYAAPDDHFVVVEHCGVGAGACHPHQWLLEVAAGSGVLGLALWFAAIAYALRAWRRAGEGARRAAFPAGVALLTILFPLNTHLAFYSAWWGLVFCWLVAAWCAAISLSDRRAEAR